MSQTPSEKPSLANAQVTGGGGHEPDPEDKSSEDPNTRAPAAGSGIDLKTNDLPDDD